VRRSAAWIAAISTCCAAPAVADPPAPEGAGTAVPSPSPAPTALAPATAAPTPPPETPPSFDWGPSAWDLVVEAWLPRLEGNLTWGGSGSSIEASDLDLDASEVVVASDLTWRNDWVAATVGGFSFSTSGTSTLPTGTVIGASTLAAPTSAGASSDVWSVYGQAAVTLYRPFEARQTPWGDATSPARDQGPRGSSVELDFDALIAIRYLSVSQSLTPLAAPTATFETQALGIGIGGGIDFRWEPGELFPWFHALGVDVQAAVGPALFAGSGSFTQLETGIEIELCPNFAARFGYRLLDWVVDTGSGRSDAGLQGLVIGGRITF